MVKTKYEDVKIIVHDGKKKEFDFRFNYSIMRKICHQRPDRSFFIFGKKLPLCARCLGIYLSFFVGIIIAILNIDWLMNFKFLQIIIFLVVGITPLLIDGFTQLYKLRESNNILRLITGALMGFVCSVFLVYVIGNLISFF
jgi:uncharacterized membrane protein